MAILLTKSDVQQVLDMKSTIESVEAAFLELPAVDLFQAAADRVLQPGEVIADGFEVGLARSSGGHRVPSAGWGRSGKSRMSGMWGPPCNGPLARWRRIGQAAGRPMPEECV